MTIDWKEDSQRFDGVADLYDAFRPSYPTELIETIVATTQLEPTVRILEIGCGTGKATALFARRGYAMLCVEPGANLAAIAARNLKGCRVEFEIARFEEWNEPANEFDLAISAQAFHWVPKEIGYAKIARALKPGGWLALFWNRYPPLKGEIFDDIERVYKEWMPKMAGNHEKLEEVVKWTEDAINASGYFQNLRIKRFPWSARYNTREYLGLLNTYSDHLRLSEPERAHLFAGIAEVIDRHGGYIERPYLSVLYLAKKRN